MKPLLLATALALVAGPAFGQAGQKWVGLQGGWDFQQEASRNAQANGIFGATYGHWCTDRWGYDLSFLGTQLVAPRVPLQGNEYHGQVGALLNLNPGTTSWVPYLRVGGGGTQVPSPWSFTDTAARKFSYHGGLGLQNIQVDNLLVGVEGRAMRILTFKPYSEIMGLVTVAYRWGGKAAPAPAAAPPPPPPAPEPAPAPKVEPPPPPPPPPPAPEPAPVPKVEPPPPPPPPAKIVLDEAMLHFANGRSDVPADGVKAIGKVAESLKGFKGDYSLVVTGYTSSVGKPAFNKALSKRRADAVAKVLVDAGIPAASISTVGAGPENPLADNKTKAGQAKNRRVEIDVKVKGQQVEVRKSETALDDK